jgi:hypothetical protein
MKIGSGERGVGSGERGVFYFHLRTRETRERESTTYERNLVSGVRGGRFSSFI